MPHSTVKNLLLLLLLIPAAAYAESGYYLGGGLSSVKLDIDHPSISSQNGSTYHILIGGRSDKWGIEAAFTGGISFSTEETQGIYYPADSADYGILDLGIKRFFNLQANPNLIPWIGVGLGLHFITWSTYYYNVDGYGYSLTGGIDYVLEHNWLVRGGVVYHDFESDDTYEYGPYDGKTTQLNFVVMYLF